MGYREYLCVPHRESSVCPHPEDVFKTLCDLLEGAVSCRLLSALDELDAADFAAPQTSQTIRSELGAFRQLQCITKGDEVARLHVPYAPWLEACRDLALLVRQPPWQLRKKFLSADGPLEASYWLVELSDALERHRSCSAVISLEAHG